MQRTLLWMMSLLLMAAAAPAGHWRGPSQNGSFPGEGLPDSWSPDGENLVWKAPVGSRSAPLVMDGRVFLINRVGEDECLQERVMALDLDSGRVLWEHRFNVFLTDIVAHRVGWANLAGDPETGYIYAHGVQGMFFCFDPDGKIIWSRSLTEEVGRISGYGGRTHSPTIEGDLVLISFLNSSWGPQGKGLHRFLAMDKRTGEMVYWSEPSGTPLDTTYATPVVHTLDGRRVLFTGLADGSIVALDPTTGERRWRTVLSKRGINSSVVFGHDSVYATHGEENIDEGVMGRVVCLDARTGKEKWRVNRLVAGYASPVLYGDLLLVPANSANLHAIDAKTGEELWEFNYGKEAKGSPIVADGKVYLGEVGGAYDILKVTRDGCERLHEVVFREPDGTPIEIFGTPTVADGRILLPTRTDLYCIGAPAEPVVKASDESDTSGVSDAGPLRIVPAETWMAPGAEQAFTVTGGEGVTFSVTGLDGKIRADGVFQASSNNVMQAGTITAAAGEEQVTSRVRIVPPLPYTEDFEGLTEGEAPPGWITSKLKCRVETYEDGKVLRKLAERPSPPFARLRGYMMPPIPAGYTVQADMLGISKKNRFLPDMGLINSRYLMILTGTSERTRKLRLVSWAPEPRIIQEVEYPWEGDAWYTVRFDVDGKGLVRGKVWPRGEEEPADWTVEMTDPCPNDAGSPGLYAYSVSITSKSKGTEVLFDNVEVKRND